MSRLVAYSIAFPADDPRPDLIWQFNTSVASLRAHNHDIDVVLFLYGPLSVQLAAHCSQHHVMVHQQGAYEDRLAALCPTGWPALATYPLLHKFLNFGALQGSGYSQVLCCDCDTVFFRDIAMLFERYGGADVVAREEVHSRRSAYGADPSFIDEDLLGHLGAATGALAWVPPFNLGVVLLGNGVWSRVAALESLLVDYAWRFVTWMALNPASELDTYEEFRGAAAAHQLMGAADVARAMPFPSVNRWILDEVALWLTLGHVRGLRTADFDPADVAQNGEYATADAPSAGWMLCHYFSQNTNRIAAWLDGRPVPT